MTMYRHRDYYIQSLNTDFTQTIECNMKAAFVLTLVGEFSVNRLFFDRIEFLSKLSSYQIDSHSLDKCLQITTFQIATGTKKKVGQYIQSLCPIKLLLWRPTVVLEVLYIHTV